MDIIRHEDAPGNPKFTVLTLTFDRPKMLKGALLSLQHQVTKDWECIVFCDGGEDVAGIIQEMDDPRFCYVHSEENNGFPLGYEIIRREGWARGKYIAYLDDDDLYYPRHLSSMGRVLDRHSQVGLVYSDVTQVQGGKIVNYWGTKGVPGAGRMDLNLFQSVNWIQPLRVLHRRYDEVKWAQAPAPDADWLYLTALVAHGVSFYYHPIILAEYRWHNTPGTPSNNSGIDGVTR